MAGMPPLSGFLGKLLVLDAMREPGVMAWTWSAILIGSLLTIVGFARAGSTLFWKSTAMPVPENDAEVEEGAQDPSPAKATPLEVAPAMATLAVLGALAIFAGPVSGYLQETSAQLFDRAGYIGAVLGNGQEG